MLWWLMTGIYRVENDNGQHASGHTTLGHNDELAFAVFYFALIFVSHNGTVSPAGQKERRDQKFISSDGFGSTGCKHMRFEHC